MRSGEKSLLEGNKCWHCGRTTTLWSIFWFFEWECFFWTRDHFYGSQRGWRHFIRPRTILRMRIQRAEVQWTKLRFETKSQSSSLFADWCLPYCQIPTSHRITQIGIWMALNLARISPSTGMMFWFLISPWNIKTHIFVTAWEEFGPIIENIVALTFLLAFREVKAIKLLKTVKLMISQISRNWRRWTNPF